MDATAGSTIGLGSTGSSTKVKLTVAELALIEQENNEKNEKVKNVIAKMKTVIVSKRLFLEREFVKYDRRVLGFITVDEFKFVLNIFGLDNPEIVGSSYEYELLINKFKGNKEVRALSMTMSRTISGYINYRKFCETVLPKDLRVMDDLKYKMVPCPEISVVVSDLEQYVKSVKRKNAQMELLAKTAAVVGSGSGHDSNITFPVKSKNASIVNGLHDEPWITAEVKRIITKAEQEISGNKDAAPPAKGKAAPKVNVDMTKAHIIATIRTKQDYVLNERNGKLVPEKVGLKAVQRDGLDYEFTVVFDLNMKNNAASSKDRTGVFFGKPEHMIGIETGRSLLKWCNEGKEISVSEVSSKINNCKTISELITLFKEVPQFNESLKPDFEKKKRELVISNN
jgi:hypothetical protein